MLPFSIGVASFVCAVVFPMIYLVMRQVRSFGAWADRSQRPMERPGVYIVFFVLFGLVFGGFAQPMVDSGASCLQKNLPFLQCVFFSPLYEQKSPSASPVTPSPYPQPRGSSKSR